jgi:hypothetical protein
MNQTTIQLIIMLLVVACVLCVLIVLLPYLKKKGVNVSTLLDNAQKTTETIDKALVVVQDILPNNPAVIVLKLIEKWAKIAVGNAEELYHSGEVTSEERAVIASQTVYNVLGEMNITVDDNKKILIDAAIKEAVLNLGHTKDPVVKAIEDPIETVVVTAKKVYATEDGIELVPKLTTETITPIS